MTLKRFLVTTLLAWVMTGCANFEALRQDLHDARESLSTVAGSVESPACSDCPIILVSVGKDGQALSYRVLGDEGGFRIVVSKAAIGLFAFHDADGNLRYDEGEPFFWQPLDVDENGKDDLKLILHRPQAGEHLPIRPLGNLMELRKRWIHGIDIQLGRQVPIADERFRRENADLGMWQPLKFMKAGLAGVYFLEPYSPTKIPVLFVHGMHGTPADFSPLLAQLDRTQYQPWLFYYPTGVELETAAHSMLGMLNKLWLEHHFSELHMVAHSMGGLVARSYLNLCWKEGECDFLRTLVTVASPFGGDIRAEGGAKYAPVVMPVWRSMAPQGEFISTLFEQALPRGVRHDLLFAYRNTSALSRTSGDGTVPLSSQLRVEAQLQADGIFGFDDNHVDILANPKVAERMHDALAGRSRRAAW